jgi:pyruvate kinase
VSHACVLADAKPGDRVLLDDGRIELVVLESNGELVTKVLVGGPISSHKGVNVPGVRLSVDVITDGDREALAWGLGSCVDFVAQSFVRDAADVEELRALIGESKVALIAKIEKREACEQLAEIISAADAIMVARGDLGVETSVEEVPALQRRTVRLARAAGKPVIVATEMLDSMRERPRPTRAEASDVATAIFQRADAVMLSAETAVGRYPLEALSTMARIAERSEVELQPLPRSQSAGGPSDVALAVSSAVAELAEDLELAAIVTATESGATARAVASHRPPTPLVAVTPHAGVARQLALVWGVRPVVAECAVEPGEILEAARVAVVATGIAQAGERIAVTGGRAAGVVGGTDFVQVLGV